MAGEKGSGVLAAKGSLVGGGGGKPVPGQEETDHGC